MATVAGLYDRRVRRGPHQTLLPADRGELPDPGAAERLGEVEVEAGLQFEQPCRVVGGSISSTASAVPAGLRELTRDVRNAELDQQVEGAQAGQDSSALQNGTTASIRRTSTARPSPTAVEQASCPMAPSPRPRDLTDPELLGEDARRPATGPPATRTSDAPAGRSGTGRAPLPWGPGRPGHVCSRARRPASAAREPAGCRDRTCPLHSPRRHPNGLRKEGRADGDGVRTGGLAAMPRCGAWGLPRGTGTGRRRTTRWPTRGTTGRADTGDEAATGPRSASVAATERAAPRCTKNRAR
ncbi:hypothetical protein SALBM311S_00554 [Streptomyces alboniger]